MSNLDPQIAAMSATPALGVESGVMDSTCLRRTLLGGGLAFLTVNLVGCGNGETAPTPPAETTETSGSTPTPGVTQQGEQPQPAGEFAATPSWEQDFSKMSDGPVDTNVWRFDLKPAVPGYNHEKQGYTDATKNARIEGGALVLEAHAEPYQYPNDPEGRRFNYTSGKVQTLGTKDFLYGRIEAAIRLPKGVGTWPAFWMLPSSTDGTKGATDAMWQNDDRLYLKNGAEIDVMENAGYQGDRVESTVHPYDANATSTGHITVPGCTERFVTYAVEWTPRGMAFFADGKKYHEAAKPQGGDPDVWGADGAHYLILNLAMGGDMGRDIKGTGPWRMAISSIKHYEYTGK